MYIYTHVCVCVCVIVEDNIFIKYNSAARFRLLDNLQSSSLSSLGATALRQPWPPVLFASTGLYPELSFSILQSPSLVGPLERHLAI